jgi:hypothetical protein
VERDIDAANGTFVDSEEPAPQRSADSHPEAAAPRAVRGFSGRGIEDISAFLGADLLMSKPLGSGDLSPADEAPADDES